MRNCRCIYIFLLVEYYTIYDNELQIISIHYKKIMQPIYELDTESLFYIINTCLWIWVQSEIKLLQEYKHPNLVKILGYCKEDEECFIVYEYMKSGSLDTFLFGKLQFE